MQPSTHGGALSAGRPEPALLRWTRWSERWRAPGSRGRRARALDRNAALVSAEVAGVSCLLLPVWLALVPATLPWVAPLAVAPLAGLWLTRLGRHRAAVALAAVTFWLQLVVLARATGGIGSPVIGALALLPIFPALHRDVAGIFLGLGAAMLGLAAVALLGPSGPPSTPLAHGTLLATVVLAHGAGVALAVTQLAAATDRSAAELAAANVGLAEARDAATFTSEAKSDLLASMSHELRTPMNAVLGMSGLLAESPLDARQKEQVEVIRASATALLQLVDEILDFSSLESGRLRLEPGPFELVAVVRQVTELMRVRAREKGLRLDLEVDPKLPTRLVADAGRVRQVLFNLVGNAVKYTEKGGVIVRAACLAADHRTATVRLEVTDTGIGIATEDLPRLFGRFEQVAPGMEHRVGGTGLGLAITRQLVELMGGRITVESRRGAGSTFRVDLKLPLAVTEASTVPDVDLPTLPAARVLLVEDNPINRKVVLAMLDRLGCVGDAAEDGEAALRRAAEHAYDVVLMDCEMPGVDGYEATRRLRASGWTGPIVALTGHVGADARRRAEDAGMDASLEKPVRLDVLHRTLARWLAT